MLSIFMEYVSGVQRCLWNVAKNDQQSIHNRLKEYGAFSEDVVRKYTRQVGLITAVLVCLSMLDFGGT